MGTEIVNIQVDMAVDPVAAVMAILPDNIERV
jgi:hypothetical protein